MEKEKLEDEVVRLVKYLKYERELSLYEAIEVCGMFINVLSQVVSEILREGKHESKEHSS